MDNSSSSLHQEPLTGPEAEHKAIAALRFLLEMQRSLGDAARRQTSKKLTVIPVAEQFALFTEKWCHTEYFIHMKRLFNCLAEKAGNEVDATHILTGENLGQVPSQTLGNLGAIERVTSLQMLRPLLGFEKNLY